MKTSFPWAQCWSHKGTHTCKLPHMAMSAHQTCIFMHVNAIFNKLLGVYNYRKDNSCTKFIHLSHSLPNILASFLLENTVTKVLGSIITPGNSISLKTCIKALKTKKRNPNYYILKTVQAFNNVGKQWLQKYLSNENIIQEYVVDKTSRAVCLRFIFRGTVCGSVYSQKYIAERSTE